MDKCIVYLGQHLLDSCRLCYRRTEECLRYYFKAGIPPLHLLLHVFVKTVGFIFSVKMKCVFLKFVVFVFKK